MKKAASMTKKAVSIMAIALMGMGIMVSCEKDNTLEDTQALYEVDATDGEIVKTDGRN